MMKFVILAVNIFIVLQVLVTAQTGGNVSPVTENIPLSNENVAEVNKKIFSTLPLHFGGLGSVLYDLITSPYALGNDFIEPSRTILNRIGFEKYRESVEHILNEADSIKFQERLEPLLKRVETIRDNVTDETFADALNIITNIFQNRETLADLRSRITSPDLFNNIGMNL